MTNLRNYEAHVDECTELFLGILKKHEGQPIDIVEYIHWYAFDVIASITFQKRLGFLDHEKDMLGLVATRSFSAKYFAFAGQVPWVHPYLLGNRRMMAMLARLYPDTPDPHGTLFGVGGMPSQIRFRANRRYSTLRDRLSSMILRKDSTDEQIFCNN